MKIKNIYISCDGTEFETEEECVKYEKKISSDAKTALKGIWYQMVSQEDLCDGSACNYYLFLKIENEMQQSQFASWYNAINDGCCKSKCDDSCPWLVGKTIMVDCYTGGELSDLEDIIYVYRFETIEKNIADYAGRIYGIANSMEWKAR